jgi:hypothetical protein
MVAEEVEAAACSEQRAITPLLSELYRSRERSARYSWAEVNRPRLEEARIAHGRDVPVIRLRN